MNVTVYAKADCQPCRLTRMKLDQMGIAYDYVEADSDGEARAKAASYGYMAAPVVVVNLGDGAEWTWAGYRPSEVEKLQKMLSGHDPQEIVAA